MDNQGLIYPMEFYPTQNDELIRMNHQIYDDIRGLCGTVQNLQFENQQLRNRISALNRKPKPKLVNSEVDFDSDSVFKYRAIYSDGSVTSVVMIMNFHGKFRLNPVESLDLPLGDNYYLLRIGSDAGGFQSVVILVSRKDLTKGSRLVHLLEAAGVCFNQAIPRKNIAAALSGTLTRMEIEAKAFSISLLAGWNAQTFQDRYKWDTIPWMNNLQTPFLPVKDKHFCREEPTQEMIEMYLDFFAGFPSWKARLTLMTYIFVGVFSSLFCEHHIPVPFYLNLLAEDVRNQDIAALFQVFNRHQLGVVSADLTTRMLERQMSSQKDEVLILDGCCSVSATSYESKRSGRPLMPLPQEWSGALPCRTGTPG